MSWRILSMRTNEVKKRIDSLANSVIRYSILMYVRLLQYERCDKEVHERWVGAGPARETRRVWYYAFSVLVGIYSQFVR